MNKNKTDGLETEAKIKEKSGKDPQAGEKQTSLQLRPSQTNSLSSIKILFFFSPFSFSFYLFLFLVPTSIQVMGPLKCKSIIERKANEKVLRLRVMIQKNQQPIKLFEPLV